MHICIDTEDRYEKYRKYNLLILSVFDEGYSRNASWALSLMAMDLS